MTAKANACYAAMRVAYEECGVPLEQLSVISGKSLAAIMARAAREGWISPAAAGPSDRERLERARSKLIGEIETLTLRRRKKTEDERERINLISATARTLARVAEALPRPERALKDLTNRDAEIAAALKRINDRIIELARHHALELARKQGFEVGGEEYPAGPGAAACA